MHHAVVTSEGLAVTDIAELVARLEAAGIEIVSASAPVMAALSPVRSPSGIVALADRPAGGERPHVRRAHAASSSAPWMSRIRGMSAPSSASPKLAARPAWSRRAVPPIRSGGKRSAARWAAPCACRSPRDPDTVAALDQARRHGCRVVVTVPRGGRAFDEARLDGATALVVGGEGAGLPAAIVAAADERVTIPMAAPVESLNTAVCAALAVYEARRQRHAHRASPDRPGTVIMDSLFPTDAEPGATAAAGQAPLAERMRPRSFDEFVGQDDLLARASRCAKPSSATCCNRSSCGDRPAPARRPWRGSSPRRPAPGSSRSARCSPASRKFAR